MRLSLEPRALLSAYASGIFPMADEDAALVWLSPDPRAILELDGLVVSRSLRAALKQQRFSVTVNAAFGDVIRACASRPDGTWISTDVVGAYERLHELGHAHSVECWLGKELAGGLYGVSIGGAFFGESMFHRATDASKVALCCLVEKLRTRGYVLLDVQFQTEHLARLGVIEIPRKVYLVRLRAAVRKRCVAIDSPEPMTQRDVRTG